MLCEVLYVNTTPRVLPQGKHNSTEDHQTRSMANAAAACERAPRLSPTLMRLLRDGGWGLIYNVCYKEG